MWLAVTFKNKNCFEVEPYKVNIDYFYLLNIRELNILDCLLKNTLPRTDCGYIYLNNFPSVVRQAGFLCSSFTLFANPTTFYHKSSLYSLTIAICKITCLIERMAKI